MICSTLAAHVSLVLSCLLNPRALAADFEQFIVPVICFLVICFPALLANQILICFMSAAHVLPVSSPVHLGYVG